MFDVDPRQTEIDILLRRSMAAPIPRLSPEFEQRLSRELRQSTQVHSQFGRILLAGYGGVSALISVALMRSQGLGWIPIAAMTLGPLAALELVRRLQRKQWGTTLRLSR